jgi:hypothetical protein
MSHNGFQITAMCQACKLMGRGTMPGVQCFNRRGGGLRRHDSTRFCSRLDASISLHAAIELDRGRFLR